jgi:hypothetical protein
MSFAAPKLQCFDSPLRSCSIDYVLFILRALMICNKTLFLFMHYTSLLEVENL